MALIQVCGDARREKAGPAGRKRRVDTKCAAELTDMRFGGDG